MPMIDVFSADGTFADKHALARDLAAAVMRWEKVPELAAVQEEHCGLCPRPSRRFAIQCRW